MISKMVFNHELEVRLDSYYLPSGVQGGPPAQKHALSGFFSTVEKTSRGGVNR